MKRRGRILAVHSKPILHASRFIFFSSLVLCTLSRPAYRITVFYHHTLSHCASCLSCHSFACFPGLSCIQFCRVLTITYIGRFFLCPFLRSFNQSSMIRVKPQRSAQLPHPSPSLSEPSVIACRIDCGTLLKFQQRCILSVIPWSDMRHTENILGPTPFRASPVAYDYCILV